MPLSRHGLSWPLRSPAGSVTSLTRRSRPSTPWGSCTHGGTCRWPGGGEGARRWEAVSGLPLPRTLSGTSRRALGTPWPPGLSS
eukprot:1750595-Alexandrium_andersonii.AAC.1